MSDQCIGEIRMFAGTFPPQGWAFCDGSTLKTQDYAALFSLIGVTYGGDGATTFGLPDLRSRLPIGMGTAASKTIFQVGNKPGSEQVVLTQAQMPTHNHPLMANKNAATTGVPTGNYMAASVNSGGGTANDAHYLAVTAPVKGTYSMNAQSVTTTGGDHPHANVMPCYGINFIIALEGIYPTMQ